MSDTDRRSVLHPLRAFKKSHRGEPNPIWLMLTTAPFEVPILLYFSILGWYGLIFGIQSRPGSVTGQLPPLLQVAWLMTFALGGTAALLGRYAQRFPVESAGLGLLAGGFFTYAATLLYIAGGVAIFASGAYLALLTGCLIRIRVIVLDRKARRVAGQIIIQRHNGDAPS